MSERRWDHIDGMDENPNCPHTAEHYDALLAHLDANEKPLADALRYGLTPELPGLTITIQGRSHDIAPGLYAINYPTDPET